MLDDKSTAPAADAVVHSEREQAPTFAILGLGRMSRLLCQKLVERGQQMPMRIVVFGEEPHAADNRLHSTDNSTGYADETLTLAEQTWYQENGIKVYLNHPVVAIDRENRFVIAASGERVSYHRLVFATGSEMFVPPIAGLQVPDKHDPLKLHNRVFVSPTLDVGLSLEEALERAARVEYDEGRNGSTVHFDDGAMLEADVLILATDTRPRSELAKAAGIQCAANGGIMVDDTLRTSDERIYAIGECAVHLA